MRQNQQNRKEYKNFNIGKLPESNLPILFFDGVCNLCNRFIQIIIKYDKKKLFRFSSLQSDAGQHVLQKLNSEFGKAPDSLILLYKGKLFFKSDAVLMIANLLGSYWRAFTLGYVIPSLLRNSLYDFIARNRYRWYGKRDKCMVPTEELKSRFLE